MSRSEQLIGLLNYVRAAQENLYAALPDAERTRGGEWSRWAPKDVVAHFTFWQNNLLKILDTLDQPPPEQESFEERNHKNYINNAMCPWAEVYADNKRSFDEIVTRVSKFSGAALTQAGRYPRITNGTLQTSILGNTYSHAVTHLSELYDRYGAPGGGLEFQEQAAYKLIEVDPSPYIKGLALYNLACAFALAGKSGRTVELLIEAFVARPDLVEYSKQDTDFNQVRERLEFQALYN